MSGLGLLNHAAQQQAAGLHAQLSSLLGPVASAPPADTSTASEQQQQQQQQAALQHLQSLALANAALGRALAATQGSKQQQQAGAPEELEEAQEAFSSREQLLGNLLQLLDSSAQGLRDQLDSCHKLLETKPCMEDPEQIIRYAHTLRYGYAPLGCTQGQLQVAPAPQLPFMLHSTLRTYHMEMAAEQQQAAPPGPEQQQQIGQLPAVQQQDASAAAAQQPQQQQQQQAAVPQQPSLASLFQLNKDLEDEEELETASEEEMSEEDYSDD
uniref:Uncharacterized protein n=1 Tax=Tetradesmus obliquus TaxID=3088 RepID=A0A383WFD6_TETOB|eukprot:jgi/Sobl393_1/5105/SZX75953.1